MDIYITDFRGIELKKVASNLYEFICKITNANSYKEILPFATQPLPSVFKAYTLNNTILNGWIKEYNMKLKELKNIIKISIEQTLLEPLLKSWL